MLNCRIVIVVLSALLTIQAQEAERKVFEAVAIKPNRTGATDSSNGSPGRLNASFTVRSLIRHAFGVPETQVVGGPPWIGSEAWDIAASTGDNTRPGNMEPFLQSVLADRFGFRYHRETREIPIYSLVVAKNGPKMKVHEGGGGSGMDGTGENGRTHLTARNQTMTRFLAYLNRNADRPVVDNTGLTSGFDFTLDWARDASPDSPYPSLFEALQSQLGLKVEAAKGSADFIVVEAVDRPTPN